ncbi:ABC transporter ATP-binding protein [Enterococcus ureilyticus]|uniref:ABC transporter ATP-binding protein n=1 Tax=Enterococcus ureilyticus TaxID=1131292 RepID=A0A1E5HF25_9ENTE|nr:ABC transporter ATP-binding protein [Enterococcus ureilyticus]MBM7689751.1 putative ABC transport system ATP-binding protein [Enterococcus ureilyticus]OEG23230.1 ABC transporter ATP-binding protein [Enterococcus ureilyticus]
MSVIEARNIKKSYGRNESRFDALKGVDLKIEAGESVAIIGKSGSGKSTFMHILALLDKPTSGEILLNDQNVTSISKKELDKTRNKQFGFVFQQFFMNPKDTVLNNVMLPLKIGGISNSKRKEMALEALKAVELEDKVNNKANNLSGGQKQRVCIARALVNNPKIIFADEPTGNLDSTTGDKIEQLLFDLNKEKGITLIIVTHDPELAARCDRQIHVRDGVIIGGGRVNEI